MIWQRCECLPHVCRLNGGVRSMSYSMHRLETTFQLGRKPENGIPWDFSATCPDWKNPPQKAAFIDGARWARNRCAVIWPQTQRYAGSKLFSLVFTPPTITFFSTFVFTGFFVPGALSFHLLYLDSTSDDFGPCAFPVSQYVTT